MSCRRIPCVGEDRSQDKSALRCECGGQNAFDRDQSEKSRNVKCQSTGSAISRYSVHSLPSPLPPLNCYCDALNWSATANCRSARSSSAVGKARQSPWQRLFVVLMCAAICASARGCGPGRSFGFSHRRNFNHRPKPLVQKEHVPNIPEQTFAASGLTEGVIKRDTPKFRKLVWVESDYIVFKDEEGTGADRFMSRVSSVSY